MQAFELFSLLKTINNCLLRLAHSCPVESDPVLQVLEGSPSNNGISTISFAVFPSCLIKDDPVLQVLEGSPLNNEISISSFAVFSLCLIKDDPVLQVLEGSPLDNEISTSSFGVFPMLLHCRFPWVKFIEFLCSIVPT